MCYFLNLGSAKIFIIGQGMDNIGVESGSAEKNAAFFVPNLRNITFVVSGANINNGSEAGFPWWFAIVDLLGYHRRVSQVRWNGNRPGFESSLGLPNFFDGFRDDDTFLHQGLTDLLVKFVEGCVSRSEWITGFHFASVMVLRMFMYFKIFARARCFTFRKFSRDIPRPLIISFKSSGGVR